jgi:hypothetical protein
MTVVVQPVPPGSKLFDTIAALTPTRLRAFQEAGADGIVAYLGLNLTADVVANAHSLGMGVAPVSPSRPNAWIPTADLGEEDADEVLEQLAALALPIGGLVDWADVEGCGADPTAYVNTRSAKLVGASLFAGMYVGAGALLSAPALYALPQVTHYWRSCSDVPMPACQWVLQQCRPGNLSAGGTLVDIDFAEQDLRGRAASWWVAS